MQSFIHEIVMFTIGVFYLIICQVIILKKSYYKNRHQTCVYHEKKYNKS